MKHTTRALVGTLVLAPLLLVACGSSPEPSADSATPPADSASNAPTATGTTVGIDDFEYSPDTVTATVGTTITWTNDQDVVHTVTADDGSFDSGDMATGATFDEAFDAVGTFAYHCSIHSNMTGTIIVQ